MEKEQIKIVNEKNELIGLKTRDTVDSAREYYQVSALWLVNPKNQVLIAQRKLTKKKNPGAWGPAVAGTVEAGEDCETNIYKEAEEEIGLNGVVFQEGPLVKNEGPPKYFVQYYLACVDLPLEAFTPQAEEVEKITWIDLEKLRSDIEDNPDKYVPSLPRMLKLLSAQADDLID